MPLEGLHHVTAITADAPRSPTSTRASSDLRLVKKTVNFDQPDVYHLYFGDEDGAPGSILTFFEFPGVALGRAGEGMVHTVQWRVASAPRSTFWADRLRAEGVAVEAVTATAVRFADPEGLRHELLAVDVDDAPLVGAMRRGPGRARAAGPARRPRLRRRPRPAGRCSRRSASSRGRRGEAWRLAGERRHGGAALRPGARPSGAHQGAGTVHHVAWSAADDAGLRAARRDVAAGAGAQPTG